MSDAGYTLAETLSALAILSLSVGAMASGLHVLGRQQSATGRTLAFGDASAAGAGRLSELFSGQGPFRSDDTPGLQGDQRQFSFPCGAETCGAAIETVDGKLQLVIDERFAIERRSPLPFATASFSYVALDEVSADWPPSGPRKRLSGVMLEVGAQRAPLAFASVRVEHPSDCQFDVVARDCR